LPKIEDSKGKEYYFYFEAPEASPGNALTVWANDEDKYFEGEKIINGKPARCGLFISSGIFRKQMMQDLDLDI